MPRGINSRDLGLLKRCAVRQNWSKVTLFNLTRMKTVSRRTNLSSFYAQKFYAKQATRRYHGEHLTKRQWQKIFRHSLRGVVGMNTRDLAATDGSQNAEGTGSGLKLELEKPKDSYMKIPYMLQTYAPMERRLDIAIFRALFASSALQARQFVIHGFVKVNGKKMQYPQYMLNPGDMFSVHIEKVLFATGAPKLSPRAHKRLPKEERAAAYAKALKNDDPKTDDAAKATKPEDAAVDSVVEKLSEATLGDAPKITKEFEEKPELNKERELNRDGKDWMKDKNLPRSYDGTKPYRTPWRPRDYLSAFAFIPKYLEVNHNTGHAVYLRHPVARPGQSEVPTPFSSDTMQLAYNWFLRRR